MKGKTKPYVTYPWREEMPLREVREVMRSLVYDGTHCPCCTQIAKVYKRTINSAMAHDLIQVYRKVGRDIPFHLPDLYGPQGHSDHREDGFPKLRFWGLVVEEQESRPDGGRAGWWHVTARGQEFIFGRLSVPQYAVVFDNRCLRLEGEMWSIRDALRKKFDYTELMVSVATPPEPLQVVLQPPLQKSLF